MLGLGKVRSVFSIQFLAHLVYYAPAAVSKTKEKSFYQERLRALQHVSCNEVLSRKADFIPSTTAVCPSPVKLGSHPLFSSSLCHLLITVSLQLSRCPLCAMTQNLQDTLWSIAQSNLDFYWFFLCNILVLLTKPWKPDYPLYCLVLSTCKMSIAVIWEYFKIKLHLLWTSTNEHTSTGESGRSN